MAVAPRQVPMNHCRKTIKDVAFTMGVTVNRSIEDQRDGHRLISDTETGKIPGPNLNLMAFGCLGLDHGKFTFRTQYHGDGWFRWLSGF